MELCFGCHTAVAEDVLFCKTCADRRKLPNDPPLSNPNELTRSSDFEGFTDPKTGEVISNGID